MAMWRTRYCRLILWFLCLLLPIQGWAMGSYCCLNPSMQNAAQEAASMPNAIAAGHSSKDSMPSGSDMGQCSKCLHCGTSVLAALTAPALLLLTHAAPVYEPFQGTTFESLIAAPPHPPPIAFSKQS